MTNRLAPTPGSTARRTSPETNHGSLTAAVVLTVAFVAVTVLTLAALSAPLVTAAAVAAAAVTVHVARTAVRAHRRTVT